jgi:hypothetical protein
MVAVCSLKEAKKMRCQRCGEKVSFWGRNCPLCHADKSEYQQYASLGFACGVSGPIAGLIFTRHILGLLLGAFLGGGVWLITTLIVNRTPPGYVQKNRSKPR